jgi:hypothetical protein
MAPDGRWGDRPSGLEELRLGRFVSVESEKLLRGVLRRRPDGRLDQGPTGLVKR